MHNPTKYVLQGRVPNRYLRSTFELPPAKAFREEPELALRSRYFKPVSQLITVVSRKMR